MGPAEVVRRLRELPEDVEVPAVVLSGIDRHTRTDPGYPSDMFAHPTKPTDAADGIEAVRHAVEVAG